ncbi:MAG: hypothetical protein K8R53_09235, partial [Bacteroidales bacterium]|nr:hypothetical protein [Bacteroidales bacterium]
MNQNISNRQQEESFDFRAIFLKLYRYWYFFIITIFIALLIAFLFNKYTKSVYEVSATILIKNDRSGVDSQTLIGFGFNNNSQNISNEVGILKSFSIVNKAVRALNLRVSYFLEENFITKELYKNSPFTIDIDTFQLQPVNLKFKITILSEQKYKLEAEGTSINLYDFINFESYNSAKLGEEVNISIDTTYFFGKQISSRHFSFKINLNEYYNPGAYRDKSLYFIFNNIDNLTGQFRNFTLDPINEDASILKISMKGSNVSKSADFLNMLIDVYLRTNLDKKNKIAENTINFIDNQLAEITDSLNFVEENLMGFRSANQVMDLNFQANRLFEQMNQLEAERAVLQVKSKYYANLKKYIEENKDLINELIIPSTLGIDDPLTNSLTLKLAELYGEKEEKLVNNTASSPVIIALDQKIATTKTTLFENIKNIIITSNISIADAERRIGELEKELNKLPVTQRRLLSIERKFKLSENIFNYLQQKRSEAQITKASNEPDNEVIDRARNSAGAPIFPKKSLNYTIAIILGLILPIIYVLGKEYLNDKIIERKDVEHITNLPIIGHIIHSHKESKLVVPDSPKSSIAESFRSVRTNLQFIAKGKKQQTILITSDMVSAGKTFCSINLAAIFAMYGKKTLLIGFDLRKPKIYQDFGLTNTEGISSFLIQKSKFED